MIMKSTSVKTAIAAAVLTLVLMLTGTGRAAAQHTLGVVGGWGMTTARLYPAQEMRAGWGVMSGGLSWRYYSAPRFVGGVGVDLEYLQKGFSYAPDSYRHDEDKDYHYYTRRYNSLSLPVVWQPHVYLFRNRLRVYLEAALNFELNINATYRYELHDGTVQAGQYTMKTVRDNRFGYGLAGGGGIDVLVGRFELGVRARYYFGLSDVMRNRNKYYDNTTDTAGPHPYENPFALTPLRSPVDNLMISIKIGFRFSADGFTEWNIRRTKRARRGEGFNYSLD